LKLHTTTKDVIGTADEAKAMNVPVGTHILTSVIEGDGPVAMCSDKATLSAKVISTSRTDSGGIQVQVAVSVSEPTAVAAPAPPPPPPTPLDNAIAYFTSKGFTAESAKAQVAQFGIDRVLAMASKELDEKLASLVAEAPKP
jgi:hypothetical protein